VEEDKVEEEEINPQTLAEPFDDEFGYQIPNPFTILE